MGLPVRGGAVVLGGALGEIAALSLGDGRGVRVPAKGVVEAAASVAGGVDRVEPSTGDALPDAGDPVASALGRVCVVPLGQAVKSRTAAIARPPTGAFTVW